MIIGHCDASTEACSRTNMVHIAAAPLCEMVWSQQNDLSLKYASSSLAEKKTSFLWSAESFNMVASTNLPHQGEASDRARDVSDRKLSLVQLESHVQDKDHCKVMPFSSPRSVNGSYGGMQLLSDKVNSESTTGFSEGSSKMDITRTHINKNEMKLAHGNWFGIPAYTQNSKMDESRIRNCKEPIICDVDDSGSSSNRRENGHEHIGAISHRKMGLTVKRIRSYESELEKLVADKRLKGHGSGSWSTSLSSQDSSFMNWVAAITNGLIGPSPVKPLELVRHPGQHGRKGSISCEDKVDFSFSHESKGFKSIFRAMYYHGSNAGGSNIKYTGKKAELFALEGPCEAEKGDVVSCCVQKRLEFDSHNCVAAAPSTIGNLNKEDNCNKTTNFGTIGLPPWDNCTKSYNKALVTGSYQFQKSLWIQRLSCKPTSSELEPMQCSNSIGFGVQKSHDGSKHHLCCAEVPSNIENKQTRNDSERIGTEKHEGSKLVPSTFARRLANLANSKALNLSGNCANTSKVCSNCGMSGHVTMECSDAAAIRPKDNLKSMPMYGRTRNASCCCIHCFQFDHWAAACLKLSSKRSIFSDNSTASMYKIHQSGSFTNDAGAIILWPRDVERDQQFNHVSSVPPKESIAAKTDLLVCSRVRCYKNESADLCRSDSHVNEVEETTKAAIKKDTAPSLKDKFLDYPLCEPKGIFLSVRKLRLSRTDITRLMKSAAQRVNIVGFFLRLRLGKPKKDLGGTGYYVACIKGSSSRSFISVCVGNSIYSVSSRFISNHDFAEHELKAWWLGKLRNGGKMPSKEDLNHKVQLRLKLGF